ncbi:MAG: hypothetical protein WAV07_14920 [Candidatus Contendobacter sp.]
MNPAQGMHERGKLTGVIDQQQHIQAKALGDQPPSNAPSVTKAVRWILQRKRQYRRFPHPQVPYRNPWRQHNRRWLGPRGGLKS